jgi:hypothetical protein
MVPEPVQAPASEDNSADCAEAGANTKDKPRMEIAAAMRGNSEKLASIEKLLLCADFIARLQNRGNSESPRVMFGNSSPMASVITAASA